MKLPPSVGYLACCDARFVTWLPRLLDEHRTVNHNSPFADQQSGDTADLKSNLLDHAQGTLIRNFPYDIGLPPKSPMRAVHRVLLVRTQPSLHAILLRINWSASQIQTTESTFCCNIILVAQHQPDRKQSSV
jgi:hypothetical protein